MPALRLAVLRADPVPVFYEADQMTRDDALTYAAIAVVFIALVAVAAIVGVSILEECRASGHAEWYCARMIGP